MVLYFQMFQDKIISILSKISASASALKIYKKFQPRYSYKIYSYIKERVSLNSVGRFVFILSLTSESVLKPCCQWNLHTLTWALRLSKRFLA